SPEKETLERTGAPGRPLGQRLAGGQGTLVQARAQVIPVGGGKGQVVVDGIGIKAVGANRVAARDQGGLRSHFQRRDELGQAECRVHRSESDQPRLPCRRYITSNGCRPNSSSDRGLWSSRMTSGRLALRCISSASAAVLAWPVRSRCRTGSVLSSARMDSLDG